MFTIHGWLTIASIVGVFIVIQLRRGVPTDLLFLGALVFVTLSGVITPEEALEGFSSNAIITIAGLLVCAAGLRSTGVLDWLGRALLGGVEEERPALVRLAITLVATSSFVLNTALVAMTMPVVLDWCRSKNVHPSRMLIPISYLTILGGVCTLVGTSTTLLVNQQLEAHVSVLEDDWARQAPPDEAESAQRAQLLKDIRPMRLFEIGKVGLPCAIIGTIVLLVLGPRLLPTTPEVSEQFDSQRREYLAELLVQPECPLIGQSIQAAGLRSLPGLFLVEINRHDEVLTPVTPTDVVYSGDRLVFSGVVETIVDLEKIPGLVPVADLTYDVSPAAQQRRNLTEVVLSRTSPVIGTTVREARFRQRYNAAIIAVHRNGARLTNKIGDIVLEPGDTLLLQTRGHFSRVYRDSRDFYLVSDVGGTPRRHDRAGVAAVLALVLIAWLCFTNFLKLRGLLPGFASTGVAAISIAGLMTAARCMTVDMARSSLNMPLLMTIGAALGLARALDKSGAAGTIAETMIGLVGENPTALLVVVYLMAVLFTESISNTAVAATMLPLAVAVGSGIGVSPRPYIMAITLAASLSFLSPIGYQTNLMVMGPGNYRPTDYVRVGTPVAFVVAVTAILVIPRIWPF